MSDPRYRARFPAYFNGQATSSSTAPQIRYPIFPQTFSNMDYVTRYPAVYNNVAAPSVQVTWAQQPRPFDQSFEQWREYATQWQQWYYYHQQQQQQQQQHLQQQAICFMNEGVPGARLPAQSETAVAAISNSNEHFDHRVKYDLKKRIAAYGGTRFSDATESAKPRQQVHVVRQPLRSNYPPQVRQTIRAPYQNRFQTQHRRKVPLRASPTPVCSINQKSSEIKSVVGTCQQLEKSYFRLTSAADPAMVRPLDVLRVAFDVVIRKGCERAINADKPFDYAYITNQLRSIRQDLTVQNIKNEFTVTVYEKNALIALETADREEFNQCQTQLHSLYNEKGINSSSQRMFLNLRLLYNMFIKDSSGALRDLDLIGSAMSEEDQLTVKLYTSYTLKSFGIFFSLYTSLPKDNYLRLLIDIFLSHIRTIMLRFILKTMRPKVSINYLTRNLAFINSDECEQFLCDSIRHSKGTADVDCRSAYTIIAAPQ